MSTFQKARAELGYRTVNIESTRRGQLQVGPEENEKVENTA